MTALVFVIFGSLVGYWASYKDLELFEKMGFKDIPIATQAWTYCMGIGCSVAIVVCFLVYAGAV